MFDRDPVKKYLYIPVADIQYPDIYMVYRRIDSFEMQGIFTSYDPYKAEPVLKFIYKLVTRDKDTYIYRFSHIALG